MISSEELKKYMHVLCSSTQCRFTDTSTGYYHSCKNPEVLAKYIEFMNGNVLLEGCKCARCYKQDCPMKEHQVSELEEEPYESKLTDEFIFLSKEGD